MYAPLDPWLDRLPRDRFPGREDLTRLVSAETRSASGAAIRFVAPASTSKEFESQYEVRVFRSGEVQTRADDWHDFFNALVWLAFPRTKAVLNRHHFEEIRSRWGQALRGTARDVLTLFDEGGVILACADTRLAELLRQFRWKELFWERRAEFVSSARCFVFGHAIYEKALEPYKGVTAKALIVDVGGGFFDAEREQQLRELDARASEYFARSESLASTRALSPLPILGIPGWNPANERADYYDDATQFRAGRAAAR
jgi:hypothetical protein